MCIRDSSYPLHGFALFPSAHSPLRGQLAGHADEGKAASHPPRLPAGGIGQELPLECPHAPVHVTAKRRCWLRYQALQPINPGAPVVLPCGMVDGFRKVGATGALMQVLEQAQPLSLIHI